MAAEPRLQTEPLLDALLDASVDFVVIGGVAMRLLGSDSMTHDLDICFARGRDNLERLSEALVELDATLRGVDHEIHFAPDAALLDRVEVLTMMTPYGRFDVLAAPAGAPRYKTLRDKAEVVDFKGREVRVASVPHMIAMKEAAGRPRDLTSVEELKAIRRLRRGDPPRDSFGQTPADVLRKLRDNAPDD
ncbi:hypothetical protein BH20ACT15_BH20ACT15_09440 [soil metagenome]